MMADALAVIGLVSAIVQFVDFGSKIVSRLNEYREAGNSVPKTFQKISIDLPLVINNLERTKGQADAGEISDETANALKPVIEACLAQTRRLEELLEKALPAAGDSTWRRRRKAVASLADWKAVQKIMSELESHLPHLLYSQTLSGSAPNTGVVVHEASQPSRLNAQSRRQPCFMVKFARVKNFVGREDIIKEIDRRFLDRQPCVAVTGVGGVGKSQIAIEYCYRYRQDHPEAHVFWVHASTPAKFAVAYQRLGEELALPGVNSPNLNTIELVRKWLNNDANGPWLLVLDNADDIETIFGSAGAEQQAGALFDHLPQCLNGSVIVTTRDRRIGQRLAPLEKPLDILPFEKEDAKTLLQKMLCENDLDHENSTALLEALDFLPMAIAQAAAFIRENSISLGEYLGFLRASDKDAKNLLAKTYHYPGRDREGPDSVFQTWKISFDCIRKQRKRAAEILALMAVLDRQAVPKTLLRKEDESEIDFATAMGTLKAFSLVVEEEAKGTFGMHHLIQLSTQKWLELEGEIEEWQNEAMVAVSRMCTADGPFVGDWKSWRSISPHARVVLNIVFQCEPLLLERATILHRLAIHELEEGYIINAEARAQEALATIQKIEGGHPKKLAIIKTVAIVLSSRGESKASEEIYRQLLEEKQAALGSHHFETLMSLEDLTYTLAMQGKFDEAETLQRQVVEAWETIPELAMHTSRFSCYTSLAFILQKRGKYEEAEETVRKALDGHTRVLGAEHLFTTHASSLLSSIFVNQGKLEAAEVIGRRALHNYKRSFGPEHGYLRDISEQMVYILETQHKFEEAERLRRQAYEAMEIRAGREHHETMYALNGLARTLMRQKRYQEAEAVLRKGGCDREERFGHEVQWATVTLFSLIEVLFLQGKWEEAEQLGRRVIHDFEGLVGHEHEETLKAQMSLFRILAERHKFEEAESLIRRLLCYYEGKFGLEDHRTLLALANLSYILGPQGRYEEAEIVGLRVFHGSEIFYGPKKAFTVICLSHVAFAQHSQGKFEAVVTMCQPLLEVYVEELGPKNSALLPLLHWVVHALLSLGRYAEAELLSRQASESYEEFLGFEDPHTLGTFGMLAFTLERQEKYEAAEPIRRRILGVQEKILGPEHAETVSSVFYLASVLHLRMQFEQASVLYQRACPALQKALGPDNIISVRCAEAFAILQSSGQNQRHLSPRYFPRVRRLISYLAGSKPT